MTARLAIFLLPVTVVFAVSCSSPKAATPIPIPEVEVATVIQKDVPLYSEWVATLDGYVNAQTGQRHTSQPRRAGSSQSRAGPPPALAGIAAKLTKASRNIVKKALLIKGLSLKEQFSSRSFINTSF